MGVFECRLFTACASGIFRVVGANFLYSLLAVLAFVAGSVAAAGDEDDSWRLIEFSVDPGTVVFANPQGSLERFVVSDSVADGLWLIDSIAADHVVLQSVDRDRRSSTGAGIVLRRGERLPDSADFEQETSFYYQIHGVVIEESDPDAVDLDGEDRQ